MGVIYPKGQTLFACISLASILRLCHAWIPIEMPAFPFLDNFSDQYLSSTRNKHATEPGVLFPMKVNNKSKVCCAGVYVEFVFTYVYIYKQNPTKVAPFDIANDNGRFPDYSSSECF